MHFVLKSPKADTGHAQSQWGRNGCRVLRTSSSVDLKNLEVLAAQHKMGSESCRQSQGKSLRSSSSYSKDPGGFSVGVRPGLIYVFKSSLGYYKLLNQDSYQEHKWKAITDFCYRGNTQGSETLTPKRTKAAAYPPERFALGSGRSWKPRPFKKRPLT